MLPMNSYFGKCIGPHLEKCLGTLFIGLGHMCIYYKDNTCSNVLMLLRINRGKKVSLRMIRMSI